MVILTRKFKPEQGSELFDLETGNCSIEYYNACKDPYRVSANKFPVPWPWICGKHSKANEAIHEQLYDSIQTILSDHNISASAAVYNRASRNTPKDAVDVLLIRTRSVDTTSWKAAAKEIYNIIEPAATTAQIEMRVEIYNDEMMYGDVSVDLIKDNSTIDAITKIQPYVLGAVMESCPGKWTSIAHHNRGLPFYKCVTRPTAIIFVKPGAIHPWAELEEKVFRTIISAAFPEEINISVEILPGRIISHTQQQPSSKTRDSGRSLSYHCVDYLPMVPSNGSSIAPSNCTEAGGTLGAVVNYRAPGKEEIKRCFLTSYDVIASGDPAGKQINDARGIGLNGREVDVQIDVDYPAKYDVRETKRFREPLVTQYEGSAKVIKRLDEITAQGPIGHVKFASGHRLTDKNHRMDWALIELDPARPLENLLPMEYRFRGRNFGNLHYDYIVQEGNTVSGTACIHNSSWYGKDGRTSDCTSAESGFIKRAIAWDDGSISHEYEHTSIDSDTRFAQDGDAGSLVFNHEKEWVGMLFAVDRCTNCAFVMPVFELVRDIEEMTGGTITLA
ncbi:hypothetical protein O988_08600 [Pseudogymnoascus sp. VKM F-3808]|nr:hypothetical protein O988_08600 [Pseudogymnoascus sp. VKM F-3808]